VTEAKDSLERNLILPPGRMSLFEGINGSTIIDSSYNASRVPVISALKTLREFPGGRKIAVLGDMRELGNESKQEHEEVASSLIKVVDELYCVGPQTQEFVVPIVKNKVVKIE
jgi:UDP-N-acetylmuramoyl-tripeptide--D-alanyl-D-alanine ligase